MPGEQPARWVRIHQRSARTALRSVIGTMTLDQALSGREQINTDVQQQMEVVTDKWGIRISRIEIVEIAPPTQILQALALEKQADQEKRAKILQSEGLQQSAINMAEGEAQASVRRAEGARQAAILRAEGERQAAILESEGRAQAIETVFRIERHPEAREARDAAFGFSDFSGAGAFDAVRGVVRAEQRQIEAAPAELAAKGGDRSGDPVDAREVDVREIEDAQAGSLRGAPV
jgi:regulator of protease activity HflC (stomatin/prohibitin superfamily)